MPPPLSHTALLLGSAVVIYLSSELFTNSVEWVGHRLAVGRRATGTVLAAFGAALPESVVTFVAVAFGAGPAQKAIGVGAALGGPLVLATLAYAWVGVILLATRRPLDHRSAQARDSFRRLSRDQGWFMLIFVAKIALGLVAFAYKPWLGLAFLAAYAAYVRAELRGGGGGGGEGDDALAPLTFAKGQASPRTGMAVGQTTLALAAIFAASHLFVSQLEALGPALGLKPALLALLLSPIATELPEMMNAMIWVRQGKQGLALANISGAMMIQATVPSAFGLVFTPWRLDPPLVLGAAVTLAAMAVLFVAFRRNQVSRGLLAAVGGLYGVFAVLLLALHLQG